MARVPGFFDIDINYTPVKANVVADALSRKKIILCQIVVSSSFLDRIAAKQDEDIILKLMKDNVHSRKGGNQGELGAQIDQNGILRINNRMCSECRWINARNA